jgi:tetratricopeptide (TPR) repeat protein
MRFPVLKYLPLYAVFGIPWVFQCSPARFPVKIPSEQFDSTRIAQANAEECFIKARDMERRGREVEAQNFYEMAYEFDPWSRELMGPVVRGYMKAGRYGQALSIVMDREKGGALTPDDYRMMAGIYWKMEEYLKAVETAEKISDKEETDFYSLAMMCETIGNAAGALRYYKEVYRNNDSSFMLAQKILRMQIEQKQFAGAESLAVAFQVRHGEKAELFDLRGALAIMQGDTAAALDYFGRALAVDSLYENALRNAARVYLQKNDYGKAIEYYETLYRAAGMNNSEYGRTLAMLYYYSKRYADAENLMVAQAENFIDDPEFHLHLGQVFVAQEKNGQARIEIEKSIALREDYAEAWRELINLSLRERNYDQAFANAERYCARSPLDCAALRLAGYALSLKKHYAGALPYFIKAVHIDSMDAGGWFELGSCNERNGLINAAAACFRRVLQLRPDDPTASNYLGYMWAEKGVELDSAEVLLESALTKDPANGAFLDSYAWVLYQQGNLDKAYRFITEAVVRINNDPVVFEHLGDILHKRNDIAGAVRAYCKSLEYGPDKPDQVRIKIINGDFLPHKNKDCN